MEPVSFGDRAPARRPPRRSPVTLLVVGLVLALVTVAVVGAYTFAEIRSLRDEQTAISERHRRDALQLLRIQNNLAMLGTLMRDLVDREGPYPMHAWQPAFDRLRRDLAEALEAERTLAPAAWPAAQHERFERLVADYWDTVDRVFALADAGDEDGAAGLARGRLFQQQRELASLISQFLVAHNRMQEDAAEANRAIYDRVGAEILWLVGALLVIIAVAGTGIVLATRRAFEEARQLAAQLRALSWRMLRVQEDVQRSVSRELHDDFGQIVTAVGTLLGRARRQLPPGSPVAAELEDVRGVAQQALDRIRTRSQWLHPGTLDDFGLEQALVRFVDQFEKQTAIRTRFAATGRLEAVHQDYAIHVYRIVQEALANIGRHSGSPEAWVRLRCTEGLLEIEVEDRGRGLGPGAAGPGGKRGMGIVSMRERAELIGGQLTFQRPDAGGLLVRVRVPLARDRSRGTEAQDRGASVPVPSS